MPQVPQDDAGRPQGDFKGVSNSKIPPAIKKGLKTITRGFYNMAGSKPLGHADESGFIFQKEMLKGDNGYGINFDVLMKHNRHGYCIFELLKCGENQKVTPHTSHPSRYWHKNKMKFIALWEAAQQLEARLFLVNYADAGTEHADEVLLMEVISIDKEGIQTEDWKMTRESFSKWYRKWNNCCCGKY